MSLLRIKQADGSWSNIPAIKGADGVDGKDGAIQYTAGRYIQIDENTNTINCTVKIGDLVIIDAVPVKDSTNVVSSGGVYDALETKADKTDIAGLGTEAGFITNSVEDLKNYYKKSETYSQEEVNSLIGNLTRLTLEVVQELPEVGTEHIIYLIPNNESGSNVYEEWLFVQSKWEMIGTTEVDLSNYYTKSEIDALMANNTNDSEFVIINMTTAITDLAGDVNSSSNYTKKKIFTLNETDRLAVTEFLNKYWGGKDSAPTKGLILRSGGRLFPLTYTGRSISSSSIGANYKSQTIVPQDSSKQMYAFTISFHVSGSAGSFTPYYSSSLSYWGTSVIFITDYLNTANTKPYTPSADYHPATKKYVDDKILDAIPQKTTMPEASATYLDKVYQYIGEDTEEFTKGFFYQCISETADDGTVTYSWSELKFNAGGDSTPINCIYDIITTDSLTADSTTLSDTLEQFTNVMSKYIAGEITTPTFRLKTDYYKSGTPEILFRLNQVSGSTYKYDAAQIKEYTSSGFYIYKHTLTLEVSTSTGNVTSATLTNKGYKILADGINKSYTPTADYHPATKKYVDDAVANAGGGSGGGSTTESEERYIRLTGGYNFFSGWLQSYPTFNSEDLTTISEYITKYYKDDDLKSLLPLTIINNKKSTSSPLSEAQVITIHNIYTEFGTIYMEGISYKNNSDQRNGCFSNIYGISIMLLTYTWEGGVFNCTRAGFRNDLISGYLTKTNTDVFTPTGDYHPATKKYVDDAVANAGGETPDLTTYAKLTDVLTKTNTTEYTPASAYHPATKQYVDQTVASAGGITTESDPTVPLHVKNITQEMIETWNNKLEAEALTEAINTAITGKDLITFSDSLQTPIITGHLCETYSKISGTSSIGHGSSLEDYDLGIITVELLNEQLKQALERIALAGNNLDAEMIYNGETELYKHLNIKVPLRCRLMLKDTVKLTLSGVEGYANINEVESPFTHPVIVDYWTNISNTGASEWLYLDYRGPHPDGPYTMTDAGCEIPFYNTKGICIGHITMDLKVTYTSDTDIVITEIRSVRFSGGGSVRYNSYEGEKRLLSTYYNDMYMTLQEDSSTSTYSLPSLYYNLNKLLLKEDESMIDFNDIIGAIPVVKESTSTYNGKDVTDYDAVAYQIEGIRRCNEPAFDSAAESGILAAGTNGTYDTVIKFADRVKVTSSYSSYSIITVNRAWLFVNYADIVSSNSEGLYAYRTSYESYKVNKETT